MPRYIRYVALLVRDYDQAVSYFTQALGFDLLEDTFIDGGDRWVAVAPRDAATRVRLIRPKTPEEAALVGRQTAGRVAFYLHTDNFRRAYETFRANGVIFLENPRRESYGIVAVFTDLYGNRWDLLELTSSENPD